MTLGHDRRARALAGWDPASLALAAALPAATAQGSIDQLHLRRGKVWALLGDGTQARPEFEAALAGARVREDRHAEYEALAGLGRLLEFDLGERAEGLQCLEEALVIAQSLGDRAGQVTLLNRLAVDLANDLEFVQAAEHTEAAVALAHDTGDERVVATALDSRKLSMR